MKSPFFFLVTAVLLLTGYNRPGEAESVSSGGGTIEAANHTHWTINHLSVNGQFGVDIIGPWQGGGGAGYFSVSSKQEPGMTARIEWEAGVGCSIDFPGFEDDKKVLEREKKQNFKIVNTTQWYLFLIITAKKPVASKCILCRATR